MVYLVKTRKIGMSLINHVYMSRGPVKADACGPLVVYFISVMLISVIQPFSRSMSFSVN